MIKLKLFLKIIFCIKKLFIKVRYSCYLLFCLQLISLSLLSSIGGYCGAGVFGLIGWQSPSPGLALPIFFNDNEWWFTIKYTYFGYLSKYQTMIYYEFCAFNYDVFIEFWVIVWVVQLLINISVSLHF